MHAYMCEKQEPIAAHDTSHADHTNLSGGLHMKQTYFLALEGFLAARFTDAFGVAFTFALALALGLAESCFGVKGLQVMQSIQRNMKCV